MGEVRGLDNEYVRRIVSSVLGAVPAESIYVFGSYARGEETPSSDVDIYVVTSDDAKRPLRYAADARRSLLWMDRPRDVLSSSRKEFERRKDKPFSVEHAVAREGVMVYG